MGVSKGKLYYEIFAAAKEWLEIMEGETGKGW